MSRPPTEAPLTAHPKGWHGFWQVALPAGICGIRKVDHRKMKGYCVACLKGTNTEHAWIQS